MNKKPKVNEKTFVDFDGFIEFGDINHNCPRRNYGDYKWNNKKKKWIESND
jgi:hypothetical protein